jgi:carboxymuconolactone decarboxylase family protein
MTRVTLHTTETAPNAARPLLDRLAETSPGLGRTLNLWAAMAGDPMTLAAYVGIREAIASHPTLDPKTRAAVALAAGSVSGGSYSPAINLRLADRFGWTPDETRRIQTGGSIEPRLDALLAVVREAVRNDGRVPDATWEQAAADWSQQELIGALTFVILTTFVDWFAAFVDLGLDPGFGAAGAVPSAAGSAA